jgi:hypothetical protein
MSQVLGTVISVSLETDVKKQAGGTYKGWELVYKTKDGQVQTIAKPVQGLKFNAALRQQLSELASGDQFTLEQEKNAAGFNDVKSITKGWAEGVSAPTAPQSAGAKTGNYAPRDYEGKEEREARQRLIVRQSSLTAAVNILSVGAKAVDKDLVKALANELTDFVFEKGSQPSSVYETDVPV